MISTFYDPAYPPGMLILGPLGPQGWVMIKVDERVTEPLDPVLPPAPQCTCGFFPDPDCPIDHMGLKKVNRCLCEPGRGQRLLS